MLVCEARPKLGISHQCKNNGKQAFREFLVSPTFISTLNIHKSVELSHTKCKILMYHSSVRFIFYLIEYLIGVYEKIMNNLSGSVYEI